MNKYFIRISLLFILIVSLISMLFKTQAIEQADAPIEVVDSVVEEKLEGKEAEKEEELIKGEIVEDPPIEIFQATIAAVGDILIHESLFKDAKIGEGLYDFKPMLEHVKPYIQQADVAFANQETMLGGVELKLSGYPMFNSPFEVGEALIDTGFDVVSIANNHTLDVGEKGVLNAIEFYTNNNLIYTGAYKSEEDRLKIRILERNGIVFSFLAYSYGTNGIRVPKGKDYLINLIDVDRINDEISRAKEISDVVVLSLHFGNEYEPLPNELQKMLANEFAKTGADIIFGHHPHVLQPMEWIEQEDGRKTFVAYSLGNFLSGQKGIAREIGGIAQLAVVKTVVDDEVSIELTDPRFLPVFTYKHNWRNYKLYPLHEIEDDKILVDAKKHLDKTKKHLTQWMPELRFDLN